VKIDRETRRPRPWSDAERAAFFTVEERRAGRLES
jgi:hypothetical protein